MSGASLSKEEDREVRPLFGITHGSEEDAWYWQSTRSESLASLGQPDNGTEVYLAVSDLTGIESDKKGWILDIETTCLNRDLPGRLPFGGGQPRLTFAKGGGTISELTCLVPPTPTLRPQLRDGNLWRLISHLSLSHLSIIGGEQGAESLHEIMKMYDYRDSSETQDLIASLISVSSERVVGRIPGERMGAGYGLESHVNVSKNELFGKRSPRSRASSRTFSRGALHDQFIRPCRCGSRRTWTAQFEQDLLVRDAEFWCDRSI